MRIILKFTILTILSVLFLMPAFVSAQEKTDPGSAKEKKTDGLTIKKIDEAAKQKTEKPTPSNDGIEFPEIDGWEKGDIVTYPQAELGYSIDYQSREGGKVTLYVYNGGLRKISSGINDEAVKAEIERVKGELVQIGKMGIYEDLKEVKSDTVTLGGTTGSVKSLHSLFNFTIRGNEVDSEIYLFAYNNNFIKIRATRPKSKAGAENKAVMNLLAEIDKMFAK